MLLADWEGTKYPMFLLFKSTPAKTKTKQQENDDERHGFGATVWKYEIKALQDQTDCEMFLNAELAIKFLKFDFGDRPNIDDNVLLLWDDFSGHWIDEVLLYAVSINVILLKIPPRYTYVCQPADVLWNKPFKSGLRSLWISRLRDQLVDYRVGSAQREVKRLQLHKKFSMPVKT
ncbi:hypothetical protein PHMEG_0004522 [Phytophthora megakarya]|uniref:DDE-1 domain-containing protein n=1 Tax=Phytophthora megakarya TaxID=4795 RepID=A0A225WTU2_9STRA|nr:hypothetical protein PHMEG_0004522 [Phytophthora megakarya]